MIPRSTVAPDRRREFFLNFFIEYVVCFHRDFEGSGAALNDRFYEFKDIIDLRQRDVSVLKDRKVDPLCVPMREVKAHLNFLYKNNRCMSRYRIWTLTRT